MRCAGDFFDKEDIPVLHPELTAWYRHMAKGFQGINRAGIPGGRSRPSRLSYKVNVVFFQKSPARVIMAEYELVTDGLLPIIQELFGFSIDCPTG